MTTIDGYKVLCLRCASDKLKIKCGHFGSRKVWCEECDEQSEMDVTLIIDREDFVDG